MYLFFLFKQKTADERRMSDWGSDVCSSYLDRWVSLPPVEARLTAALLDRYGAVVSRDALARAGWPTGSPGRNDLDVPVLRLRRHVAPLARKSVVSGKSVFVRVDLGGRRFTINKQHKSSSYITNY